MTILDALAWGTEKIRSTAHEKKTGAHIPSYDAQLLLTHTLQVRTSFLFAHGNDALTDEQWELFRGMVLRRATHEPISHILQSAIFFGRSFFVNRHVLTPRPETEELVELALKEQQTEIYVDIGTGSGAIAITLALESKKRVYATDIDPLALRVAKFNTESLGADVHFSEGDLLDAIPDTVIQQPNITYVANLPYIPTGARKDIDPDVLQYEPHGALFSGIDGLELSMRLLRQLPQEQSFVLLMELDRANVVFFSELAQALFPTGQTEILQDLSKKPRFFRLVHKYQI